MSRIKILPEILSNKIAAGEVVERPSSVVKELVENALDADSTRIIVEVEKGGRSSIQVSDNGIGMNRDDALLSTERYATSKIYNEDDLFSIRTLGFRGEAIPSIASVSRFTLETRDENSQAGTRIVINGGKIQDVSDAGAPTGTLVAVRQLFFNTPARRKFLKTVNTEMGHIADTVASIALGWSGILFRLHHNGKIIKNWPSVSDPVERVADVLGRDIRNDLHEIFFANGLKQGGISVSGWTASPQFTRSTSRGIYVYVNGRFVRDRVIQHALFEGYAGRLMKGQYPVAVVFINVDPDNVDVNVHPAKNEVRFAQQNDVHDAVVKAVFKAFDTAETFKVSKTLNTDSGSGTWEQNNKPDQKQAHISETTDNFNQPSENLPLPIESSNNYETEPPESFYKEKVQFSPQKESFQSLASEKRVQEGLWKKKQFSDLRVIGQYHGSYIICESEQELVLIDQHAAHERILFEQLKKQSAISGEAAQHLLIPETFNLGYSEADMLEKLIPDLKEKGLEIEPFGGNTFIVKSVPAILRNTDVKSLAIEIVEKMVKIGFTSDLENAINESLMIMACHGAIRSNQHLSDKQIKGLLEQLDECENPFNCPHGRPVWIKWTTRFLEKSFKRTA
ncbi:MAG: DNA mismatch repair endonuclease MutL [Desulfobacteraceae bacterium]|nr:DNA mismatch repair endonuclease MutL [Desulfobacteraceae bacterium]